MSRSSRSASASTSTAEAAVADRGKVTLLDLAIAASLAIVPVLLGVIALVAVVRPGDPDGIDRQGRSDRYVSVRRVAALKTFERAVVPRGTDAPSTRARDVLAGVPPCQREWGGGSATSRWLREISGAAAEATPAEQIALRLGEVDAALLRF